jgi:hypothetical protein
MSTTLRIHVNPFVRCLEDLRSWRQSVTAALTDFRRWALVGRLIDEQTGARLAHLEGRISNERLTIAFVGEFSRGKSELVNALFFGDLGTRLVPSGMGQTTLCPMEILWDPARPVALLLLPIETRESPKALREHIAEGQGWKEIAIDPKDPEATARACHAISETRRVSAGEAATLGFEGEGDAPMDIPRWRYAILNLPHTLLKQGLAILDTPATTPWASSPRSRCIACPMPPPSSSCSARTPG